MNWINIEEQVPPLNTLKLLAYRDDDNETQVTVGYRQETKVQYGDITSFLPDIYIDFVTQQTNTPIAWRNFPDYTYCDFKEEKTNETE